MSILLSILSAIAITIAKGWQVHKQLWTDSYPRKSFGLIVLAWSAMTLPFIASACNETACQWSLRFGWWANLIHQVPPFDKIGLGTTIAAVMVAYVLLTIYFLGHCLGWVLYGTRRLVQFKYRL